MIGEKIESILIAEQQAAKLRHEAQLSVNKIEKKTQLEIENLKTEHAKELNERIRNLQNISPKEPDASKIAVDKSKMQAAVKHIIANLLRGSA